MATPLVDRNTGDVIPADDHNDVKAYVEDGTYRVKTAHLELVPGTEPTAAKGVFYYDSTDDLFYGCTDGSTFEEIGKQGTVTSVGSGNGMNFSAITSSGDVALGTPSTLTNATTNNVTSTSHTHELDLSGYNYITTASVTYETLNTNGDVGTTASTLAAGNDSRFHDAVTILDSSEIDFTLTGQQITASLKSGSIDESKLDTSVNDSLDLADSALQSEDNISELNNDSGYTTNSGTVTSVAVSGSDGIEIDSGSPITTSGTIALGVNKTTMLSTLNVEDGADVTDTANVTSAGALMDSELTSLTGIKTLTVPDNTTISTFGKSLIDDTDAATARATLDVDQAGTDNSTDVTLVGSLDYLTIDGQTITRNAIDLTADVTGNLPDGNIASASTWNAKQDALTFGIADTNAVKIDDADAVENDYTKLTTTGLVGRSYSEVKTDLSLNNVENTAISTWTGSSNITTVGTIGTGTWQGTDIAVGYIDGSSGSNGQVLTSNGTNASWQDLASDSTKVDKNLTILSKTSNYTVTSSDNNKVIHCSNSITITLPDDLDTGFNVTIVNIGTGTITLSASTTLRTKDSNTKLSDQYGAATAYHSGSDIWYAYGDLSA